MSLPLPNLDDRTYADLVEEARSLIPIECPDWTDHNPSDTGIILIELLAWLSEMMLYQVNQIPDQNIATFLQLLNGTSPNKTSLQAPDDSSGYVDRKGQTEQIRKTLLALRQRHRAVTPEDYEQLVLSNYRAVKRVHCLPKTNIHDLSLSAAEAIAHMSLIVIFKPTEPPLTQQERETLLQQIWDDLENRRLLTTRHHVSEPFPVALNVSATLYLKDGTNTVQVLATAAAQIEDFFSPVGSQAHWQGNGFPFGRNIYQSDLYQLLDRISGIDFVEDVQLARSNPSRSNQPQSAQDLTLQNYEVVDIKQITTSFSIKERWGNGWRNV